MDAGSWDDHGCGGSGDDSASARVSRMIQRTSEEKNRACGINMCMRTYVTGIPLQVSDTTRQDMH